MILSRCHQEKVFVVNGDEGTSFYACTQCERACDTISAVDYLLSPEIGNAEV